ncbi:MAG: rRNA maturation RNase YbeY [Bacteroidota bacterium]
MGEIEIEGITDLVPDKLIYTEWLENVINIEGCSLGNLTFVLCTDDYLLDLNQRFLNHDWYTDVITFDYSEGNLVSGDVIISMDRVGDNAKKYNVDVEEELKRVMVHGVLHLLGYGDKTDAEVAVMRIKEDEMIKMFHVEQ